MPQGKTPVCQVLIFTTALRLHTPPYIYRLGVPMASPHPMGTIPLLVLAPISGDNCHVRARGERLVPALRRQRPGAPSPSTAPCPG